MIEENHMQQVYILRFVPNTMRGEFINVGVLCGNDEDGWELRYLKDTKRMVSFGGEDAAHVAQTVIKRFYQDRLDRFDQDTLTDWVANQSGTVQIAHGGSTPEPSAGEAADRCFSMFVETTPFPVTQPA